MFIVRVQTGAVCSLNSRSQIRNGRHSYENDNPLPVIFPEEWGSPPVISRKVSRKVSRKGSRRSEVSSIVSVMAESHIIHDHRGGLIFAN